MKLHIQATERCDREQLRALLIDAADQLAGKHSCLLEAKLPWDGYPILLADTEGHPVLVSFDTENSLAALLNGLQAADQLATALPWVNQVYAALQNRQEPPRLVVVTRETPPGSEAVLAGSPRLALFTCKVLLVNGDTGVLLERIDEPALAATVVVPTVVPAREAELRTRRQSAAQPADDRLPSLSDAERAYFRQL
jgi:hypothetical protein